MYVDDVARAFTVLLDGSHTGAVNIGTGEPVTIAEVAQSAARAAGAPELLELGALPARAGEPDVLLADTTQLRKIGFTTRWNLDDAMAATLIGGAHRDIETRFSSITTSAMSSFPRNFNS